MVDFINKDLFLKDSIHKDIIITWRNGILHNEDIYSESLELVESISTDEEPRLGTCGASLFRITIANVVTSMLKKDISVYIVLNNDDEHPFHLGDYKVYSDELSSDKSKRTLTCYDALYKVLHANVAKWYKNLALPMTLEMFRNSFFAKFGITQANVSLRNDWITVKRTIDPDEELSGADVLEKICEINGCFGRMGRDGKFHYVKLETVSPGLYPSNTLYPKNDLYPQESNIAEEINGNVYTECLFEDYETNPIETLQIIQEEGDIGVVCGFGQNPYTISDNFLIYGLNETELRAIGNNLLDELEGIMWTPAKINCMGNPCVEAGDIVRALTPNGLFTTYVFQRTLKGIQTMTDEIISTGSQDVPEDVNGYGKQITKLKGKSAVLKRTCEELSNTITNVEAGLQSQILQTAKEIKLTVQSTTVVYDESYYMYPAHTGDPNTETKLKNRGNGNPNSILPSGATLKPAGGSGTDATYFYFLDLETGNVWRRKPNESSFTKMSSHSPLPKMNDSASGQFNVQASEISAKVSQTGSNGDNTFSWSLKSTKFSLSANGTEVFKCDKNGIEVKGNAKVTGEITATKLTISAGATISGTLSADHISGGTLTIGGITWSGSFGTGNIPNLNASKITSGVFSDSRISANIMRTSQLTADYISSKFTGSNWLNVDNVKVAQDILFDYESQTKAFTPRRVIIGGVSMIVLASQ